LVCYLPQRHVSDALAIFREPIVGAADFSKPSVERFVRECSPDFRFAFGGLDSSAYGARDLAQLSMG
jgi:hypothetical protein